MVLLIYGSGGLGRGLYDWITRNNGKNRWNDVAFINDMEAEEAFYGVTRLHFDSISSMYRRDEAEILIAVGEPDSREKLYHKVKKAGYRLADYIDETATVSPSAVLEEGVIICPYALVDSNAVIHANALIENQCVVGHDTVIGSCAVVSSHSVIGGFTSIGEKAFMGIGTLVKDRLTVGNNVITAMGSVVFRDIEAGMTVMGNPARVTRGNDDHRVFR